MLETQPEETVSMSVHVCFSFFSFLFFGSKHKLEPLHGDKTFKKSIG